MTHLERFKNSIARKAFDRIPMSIHMTDEMCNDMLDYTDLDHDTLLYKAFDIDRRGAWPEYTGPEPKSYPDGTWDSVFGVRMKYVEYGRGGYCEAVINPLADMATPGEIRNYPWPRAEWHDYGSILKPLREYPDYAFTIGYTALGWYAWDLRGMSRFLEDLVLEPELADAIIQALSDYSYEYFRRIIEAGRDHIGRNFVAIQIADDWATQEGLMIGITHFKRYFKPHYRRIVELAHSAGLLVEYHCCGSAVKLVPDLIDLGVDILNPIQTSARDMVPHLLKQEFGRDIAFSGGVDVQTVLPFGDPQKVRDEVFYLLDTMGKDGGYILEPSHAIQVGTPPENVIAMYRAAHEYYGVTNELLEAIRR